MGLPADIDGDIMEIADKLAVILEEPHFPGALVMALGASAESAASLDTDEGEFDEMVGEAADTIIAALKTTIGRSERVALKVLARALTVAAARSLGNAIARKAVLN